MRPGVSHPEGQLCPTTWEACFSRGGAAAASLMLPRQVLSLHWNCVFFCSLFRPSAGGSLNSHPLTSSCHCFVPESSRCQRCLVAVGETFCVRGERRGRVLFQLMVTSPCSCAAKQDCFPSPLWHRFASGWFCSDSLGYNKGDYSVEFSCLAGAQRRAACCCVRVLYPGLPRSSTQTQNASSPSRRHAFPSFHPLSRAAERSDKGTAWKARR